MKNILYKLFLTIILFFSSLISFAQPGDGSDTGGLEGGDTPVPINDSLIILGLIGVVFAFCFLKKNNKSQPI